MALCSQEALGSLWMELQLLRGRRGTAYQLRAGSTTMWGSWSRTFCQKQEGSSPLTPPIRWMMSLSVPLPFHSFLNTDRRGLWG